MPLKNDKILDLVKAISTRVKERDGYLNKTKLVKYLYLIDIEYYRVHKETFTGFNWIFKDYGPWAFEYNDVFDAIKSSPDFRINEGARPDIDITFINVTKEGETELDQVIEDFSIERVARQIIDRWADESLGPMLNYVYFNTDPMVDAERYKPLDFTKIRLASVPKFKLKKSSLSTRQLNKLRGEIRSKKAEKGEKPTTSFTAPQYDEIYWQGMQALDKDDTF